MEDARSKGRLGLCWHVYSTLWPQSTLGLSWRTNTNTPIAENQRSQSRATDAKVTKRMLLRHILNSKLRFSLQNGCLMGSGVRPDMKLHRSSSKSNHYNPVSQHDRVTKLRRLLSQDGGYTRWPCQFRARAARNIQVHYKPAITGTSIGLNRWSRWIKILYDSL